MFSVVRGYNILVIVLAQYLTSVYILAHDKPLKEVLFDINLLLLVLASSAAIAAGYIINNFYDSEKDLINRGYRSLELNARDIAVGFYERLGYKIQGERFVEVSIDHYKMTKTLVP